MYIPVESRHTVLVQPVASVVARYCDRMSSAALVDWDHIGWASRK